MNKSYKKYSATGNTFLIFEDFNAKLDHLNQNLWNRLAIEHNVDGVLFLRLSNQQDFKMIYLNCDGTEVEMCGNGARAITHFFHNFVTKKPQNKYHFDTKNGVYCAYISDNISVQMTELKENGLINIEDLSPDKGFSHYINTGVPHCVFQVQDIKNIKVVKLGEKVRYDQRFKNGTNCNFVEIKNKNMIEIRTYERGVEGETLSCGTGITAAAISLAEKNLVCSPLTVIAQGGTLKVTWNDNFSEIYLSGPVEVTESGILYF